MLQRVVFGESLSDKLEIKTKASQDGAQGNQLGLWLAPLTALISWSSEELSNLGSDGQIDIGSVDG